MTELGGSPQARAARRPPPCRRASFAAWRASSSLSEILRTPLLFSGHVPLLCFGGAPVLAGDACGRRSVVFRSVNLSFLASLCMCGAASSPALLLPSPRTPSPTPRVRAAEPRTMPVKSRLACRSCTLWGFAPAREEPLHPSLDVFDNRGQPPCPARRRNPDIRPAPDQHKQAHAAAARGKMLDPELACPREEDRTPPQSPASNPPPTPSLERVTRRDLLRLKFHHRRAIRVVNVGGARACRLGSQTKAHVGLRVRISSGLPGRRRGFDHPGLAERPERVAGWVLVDEFPERPSDEARRGSGLRGLRAPGARGECLH